MTTKTKIERISTAINLGNNLWTHGKNIRDWYRTRNSFVATIDDDAYVYPALMGWLNERVTGQRYRFDSRNGAVEMYYDTTERTEFDLNGHTIYVYMGSDETGSAGGEGETYMAMPSRTILTFEAQSLAGINALHVLLKDLTKTMKAYNREAEMYNLATWNGWDSVPLPKRKLESVFLPNGTKEELMNDLRSFISGEEQYLHIGLPWHRGYMLYGPPGNGKSSLVAGLANEFKFNLYNMPLSNVSTDRALMDVVTKIQPDSILLIEDIDIFASSVRREDKQGGVTLAGLLNALDGVSTPHGLITFITTNHKETLDPALIRPGRIDYTLKLTPPDADQIDNMFRHVYGQSLGVEAKTFGSMAELTNVFKMHVNDPEAARLVIKGVVQDPTD